LALEYGRRPRPRRPLSWLSDLELAAERNDAQTSADAANRRLDEAMTEQGSRAKDADPAPDS
jgi:hypothetical protein